jgi:hypothetical protein
MKGIGAQGSLVKGILKEGLSEFELIRKVSGINIPFNFTFDKLSHRVKFKEIK